MHRHLQLREFIQMKYQSHFYELIVQMTKQMYHMYVWLKNLVII